MGGGEGSFDFSDKAVVARNKTASTRNLRFIIHPGSDRRIGALMLRPARRGCYNILRSPEQSIGDVVRARDGVREICGRGLLVDGVSPGPAGHGGAKRPAKGDFHLLVTNFATN